MFLSFVTQRAAAGTLCLWWWGEAGSSGLHKPMAFLPGLRKQGWLGLDHLDRMVKGPGARAERMQRESGDACTAVMGSDEPGLEGGHQPRCHQECRGKKEAKK